MRSNTSNRTGSSANIHTGHRRTLFVACAVLCVLPLLLGMASKKRPRVYIRTLANGHYRLMVRNRPFVVKGVCYNPIPIGENHQYDWWNDANKPWMVDGRLMKQMGVNTIRIYQPGADIEAVRRVIRDLYEEFGIYTILGHWLGFWEYPCPFYGDSDFQERIKKEVLEMVEAFRDEPGVLMWILGNENNYSCLGRINPWSTDEIDAEEDPAKQRRMRSRIYYSYVNDIARSIHEIDTEHPVALGNGELIGLEEANEVCPNIDLVACIIYRGKTFGNLFNSLRMTFDRPILLSEFGADGYDAYKQKEDQNFQAFFLESQWRQIYQNLAGQKDGAGNCIGGAMFEWTDEWWKADESNPDSWLIHDTTSNWSNGSYYFDIQAEGNKNMNEEWFGIVGLSEELEEGLHKRTPKKAYYVIKEFWRKPVLKEKKKRK
ncbi:MAG: hypothetical protein MJA29_06690, partial [Candidatus Omnitrophica bacterium]|nr:hypothetical protein [Candidatus Omnitrophota bacterium]